jgi:ATP-binding cassette subfamily C protein LapB
MMAAPPKATSLFWSLVPRWPVLAPALLATIGSNLLALSIPLATMNIFDRVLTNGSVSTLHVIVFGVLLSILFDFAFRSLRALIMDRGAVGADIHLLTDVFGRLVDARDDKVAVGTRSSALKEYESVREYFNAGSLSAFGDIPFILIFLAGIYWIAGGLAAVPAIAAACLLVTICAIQLRASRLIRSQFFASAHKNAVATELLAAMPTLQNAAGKDWARQRWEEAAANQLRQGLKLRFWTGLSLNLMAVFQALTTIAILGLGAQAVMNGNLSPGGLFAANLLASRCLAPVASLAGLASRFSQMKLAYSQLNDILALPSEEEPAFRQNGSAIKLSQHVKQLALKDVNLRYEETCPLALRDVSLTFARGQNTGIIGSIGSGKSTVAELLSGRLQPSEGSVTLDDVSLCAVDLTSWRMAAGILPQAPGFFAASLRDNIDLGKGYEDKHIWHALKQSGADTWVNSHGQGLELMIGERGAGLSGGQLQSLALARAFLGQPSWLILDEPTNHLDGLIERKVITSLNNMRSTTTTIAISHKPAVIEAMDRLIVIEAGEVKLDGPKDDVLQRLREMNAATGLAKARPA